MEQSIASRLTDLESDGIVRQHREGGWVPNYEHPIVTRANEAIEAVKDIIRKYPELLEERFADEYPDIPFGLQYAPFWETLFRVHIYRTV